MKIVQISQHLTKWIDRNDLEALYSKWKYFHRVWNATSGKRWENFKKVATIPRYLYYTWIL